MVETWKPHAYQKTAIQFLVERPFCGLFQEPGLGKTSEVFGAFAALRKAGLVQRMLVVAPLRVAQSVWPSEAAKWKQFSGFRIHVLHGKHKDELLRAPHDVSVVNPEGLDWLFETLGWRPAFSGLTGTGTGVHPGWQWLVVDESTRFKHTNTQRFKTLKPYLPRFKRRTILTGSPAPNGLLDLFGQVYLVDQGRALGQFVTHFRTEFFNQTGFGGYTWVPKSGAAERIYARLQPLVLRMAAADHLDLPPLLHNTIRVELPDEARRTYAQMEELLMAEVEGELVTAANAAAATLKCRQIANGSVYTDAGLSAKRRSWEAVHSAKLDAVTDLVEELAGQPALIAYEFEHERERLLKAFPNARWIGGGVPGDELKQTIELWNRGVLSVLLAQPQSVAHGLNLQGVNAAVIWHSLTWDLEVYEQFIRRIWRQGQTGSVVVHHVVASKTVDEAVMKAVGRKDKTQRALMDALRDYSRSR